MAISFGKVVVFCPKTVDVDLAELVEIARSHGCKNDSEVIAFVQAFLRNLLNG